MQTTEQLQTRIRKALAKYGKHTMRELCTRLEMAGAATMLRTAIRGMDDVRFEGTTQARKYWVEVSK